MNKATLTGVTLAIILGLTLFLGMYTWFKWNADESGVSIDSKYSNIYSNLNTTESELESSLEEIKDVANELEEPESYLAVAFGGLRGLLALLILPFKIFNAAISSFFIITTGIEIPSWAFVGLYLTIFTVILFVIIGLIKGEQKT